MGGLPARSVTSALKTSRSVKLPKRPLPPQAKLPSGTVTGMPQPVTPWPAGRSAAAPHGRNSVVNTRTHSNRSSTGSWCRSGAQVTRGGVWSTTTVSGTCSTRCPSTTAVTGYSPSGVDVTSKDTLVPGASATVVTGEPATRISTEVGSGPVKASSASWKEVTPLATIGLNGSRSSQVMRAEGVHQPANGRAWVRSSRWPP
jgi:hypothetical protein